MESNKSDISPTCEICGKVATHIVRDCTRDASPKHCGSVVYKPYGPTRRFCSEHARKSIVYDVTTTGLHEL